MNRVFQNLILCLVLFAYSKNSFAESTNKAIKIACIGDSITFGYLVKNREENSYPALLQKELGEAFEVLNFGVPSKTVLRSNGKSIQPYVSTPTYKKALEIKADIILVMLGANDSKPNNWNTGKKQFKKDFEYLIQSLKSKRSTVIWCIPTSIQNNLQPMAKNLNEIIEQEKVIAEKLGLPFIDLHSPTKSKPALFIDGLHPNKKGCELISKIIAKEIKKAPIKK